MESLNSLDIKVFADGADLESIRNYIKNPLIKGFTTNPTLMRAAGVENYKEFALNVLKLVTDLPVSFEVFADDLPNMEAQALEIASWAKNVVVKIPITNTEGVSTSKIIKTLSERGVAINVTAILTLEQFKTALNSIADNQYAILSVFAGRIADTGVDPCKIMKKAVKLAKNKPLVEILWASPREVLNIFQANDIGCHIITVTYDLLKKANNIGKDLNQFSLETVEMFYKDATQAGYTIDLHKRPERKDTEIIEIISNPENLTSLNDVLILKSEDKIQETITNPNSIRT